MKARPKHYVRVECWRDDRPVWQEEMGNIVFNEGLNDILDKYYKASGYTAAHYVGLTSASPSFAASDTMASHPGWTEVTVYSESSRPLVQWGSVSGGQLTNAAAPAVFSINGNANVGGIFITTNATKGGNSGLLIAAAAFSQNRSLLNGDTLRITVTAQMTSS